MPSAGRTSFPFSTRARGADTVQPYLNVFISHRSPSEIKVTAPWRSVRRTTLPASRRRASVFGEGCPNRFDAPALMTAHFGDTILRNFSVEEEALPW